MTIETKLFSSVSKRESKLVATDKQCCSLSDVNMLTPFAIQDNFENLNEEYRGLNPAPELVPHMFIVDHFLEIISVLVLQTASLAEIFRPNPHCILHLPTAVKLVSPSGNL